MDILCAIAMNLTKSTKSLLMSRHVDVVPQHTEEFSENEDYDTSPPVWARFCPKFKFEFENGTYSVHIPVLEFYSNGIVISPAIT
jgi:hypothetical protein